MTKLKKTTKKSWKQRLLSKKFIIPASIIGVILIGIGIYLIPDYYNHAVLDTSVQNEGAILLSIDKGLTNSHDASSCDFVSGVGLSGGGWGCTAIWTASTTIQDVDGMKAMATAFKRSSDFRFISSDSINDLPSILLRPKSFAESAIFFGVTSLNLKTGTTCSLRFTDVASESDPATIQRVDIRLMCEMDARLPWYSTTSGY